MIQVGFVVVLHARHLQRRQGEGQERGVVSSVGTLKLKKLQCQCLHEYSWFFIPLQVEGKYGTVLEPAFI